MANAIVSSILVSGQAAMLGAGLPVAKGVITESVASGATSAVAGDKGGIYKVTAVGGAMYIAEGSTVTATTGIYLADGESYHILVGAGGQVAALDA